MALHRAGSWLVALIVLVNTSFVFGDDVLGSNYFDQDKSDWVDPGDIFTYDHQLKRNVDSVHKSVQTETQCDCEEPQPCPAHDISKLQDKLASCKTELHSWKALMDKKSCEHRAEAFFRRISQKAFNQIQHLREQSHDKSGTTVHFSIDFDELIFLTGHHAGEFQSDCGAIEKVTDTMSDILDRTYVTEKVPFIEMHLHLLPYCFMSLAVSYVVIRCAQRGVGLKRIFLITCFLWQWFKRYKEVTAKRLHESTKIPQECLDGGNPDASWENSLKFWASSVANSLVGFSNKDKGICAEYYRSLAVNPFLDVNPAEIFSDVLGMLFFYPMQLFGDYLGVSVQQFFSHIPLIYTPFVGIGIMFLFIVILLMLFGYSLNLPFVSLRPSGIPTLGLHLTTSPSTNAVENTRPSRDEIPRNSSRREQLRRSRSMVNFGEAADQFRR